MVPSRRAARVAVLVLAIGALTACTRTSIEGLQVRSGPGTASRVVAEIPRSGTPVRVSCWTRGEPVQGDTVWYRIGAPEEGWVTNYYIRSTSDFGGRPRC